VTKCRRKDQEMGQVVEVGSLVTEIVASGGGAFSLGRRRSLLEAEGTG
jgi:hypothetical protein